MIYETAVLARADVTDDQVASLKDMVTTVIKDFGGEILVHDDWGARTLAQATGKNIKKGRFFYFMYKSQKSPNAEITRKLSIQDSVVRSMIIQLGKDSAQEELVKNYRSPFQS